MTTTKRPAPAEHESETTREHVANEIRKLADTNRAVRVQAYTLRRWANVLLGEER